MAPDLFVGGLLERLGRPGDNFGESTEDVVLIALCEDTTCMCLFGGAVDVVLRALCEETTCICLLGSAVDVVLNALCEEITCICLFAMQELLDFETKCCFLGLPLAL